MIYLLEDDQNIREFTIKAVRGAGTDPCGSGDCFPVHYADITEAAE